MSERMHTTRLRSKLSNRTIAFLLIVVGIVIFVNTTGIFNDAVWDVLWPLAMIGVGVDLVTEGRHRRRVIAGTLLGAAVCLPVVGMAGLFGTGTGSSEADRAEDLRVVPMWEGMQRLQVDISGVVGEISIGEGDDRGQAADLGRDDVSKNFELSGETGVLNIYGSGNSDEDLDLEFRRDLPLDLRINSGAESASLDLEDLRVEQLNLNVGTGNAQLNLPNEGVIEATISSELGGRVDIQIPEDLPARIEVDASASKLDIDDRFRKDGDAYVSEDYNAEEGDRALIHINATVGNVKVH